MKREARNIGIVFVGLTIALSAPGIWATGENPPFEQPLPRITERPDLVAAAHELVSETVLPHAQYSLGIDLQFAPELRGTPSKASSRPCLTPWEQTFLAHKVQQTFAGSRLFHPVILLNVFDRVTSPVDYVLTVYLVHAETMRTSRRLGFDLEVELCTRSGERVWRSSRLHIDTQREPGSLIADPSAVALAGTVFNTVGDAIGTGLIPVPDRPEMELPAQMAEEATHK